MSQEAQFQFKQFFISLIVIILLGGVIYSAYGMYKSIAENEGNNSENQFQNSDQHSNQHNEQNTTSWNTSTDIKQGVSFKYPSTPFVHQSSQTSTTTYLSATDWPPHIQLVDERYACIEAGLETGRAGRTSRVIVNSHEYCVTKVQEGAAGSTYIQYAYAFPFITSNATAKTAIFTFTMRFPQCLNYDNPQQAECQQVQASFDTDKLVDVMAGTVKGL